MIASGEIQSQEDLINNAVTFFIAGNDTTSSALTSTILLLSKNIEMQNIARKEVLEIVGTDMKIIPEAEDLNKMEYLTMVIKESIRYIPIIPLAERDVSHNYKFSNGLAIKKGNVVAIDHYSCLYDEKVYKNPHEFSPERFSRENKESNKKWKPFGYGPKACIGMNLSLMQQKIILSSLLMNYEFRLATNKEGYSSDEIKLGGNSLVLSASNVYVDFIKRK